jgi:hypothetical protein
MRKLRIVRVRVGDRSRGRFATPADSPLHDGTPYRGLRVRRWDMGLVHRTRTILVAQTLTYDSQRFRRCRTLGHAPSRFSPTRGVATFRGVTTVFFFSFAGAARVDSGRGSSSSLTISGTSTSPSTFALARCRPACCLVLRCKSCES